MQSLKKSRQFRRVYTKGKSRATKYLVLYKAKNLEDNFNRYGFSISKRVGTAVVRNKLKRRLKEIIRDLEKRNLIKIGYDLIFIARKPVVNLDFWELRRDVLKLFKKMDLYLE